MKFRVCKESAFFAHKSEFEFQFADVDGPPLGTSLSFTPGIDPKSGKERATYIRAEPVAQRGGGRIITGGRISPVIPHHVQTAVCRAPVQVAHGAGVYARPSFVHQLRGTLCEWNDHRACGFIECGDPPGKRFFAHKSEFVQQFPDGQGPPVGTPMVFVLGSDPKSGKQRAQEIQIESMQSTVSAGPQRLCGTLVDWKHEKACGFIQCFDPAGKKFFAHKTEFAVQFSDGEEPPVGTMLSFVPGVDTKSGRERAQDIQLATEEAQSEDVSRIYGTLIDWKDGKACGFIECVDPPGKRIFAHKSEFAEAFVDGAAPPIGTEMSFVLGVDTKSGKERAQDIRVEEPSLLQDDGAFNFNGRKRARSEGDTWE